MEIAFCWQWFLCFCSVIVLKHPVLVLSLNSSFEILFLSLYWKTVLWLSLATILVDAVLQTGMICWCRWKRTLWHRLILGVCAIYSRQRLILLPQERQAETWAMVGLFLPREEEVSGREGSGDRELWGRCLLCTSPEPALGTNVKAKSLCDLLSLNMLQLPWLWAAMAANIGQSHCLLKVTGCRMLAG